MHIHTYTCIYIYIYIHTYIHIYRERDTCTESGPPDAGLRDPLQELNGPRTLVLIGNDSV